MYQIYHYLNPNNKKIQTSNLSKHESDYGLGKTGFCALRGGPLGANLTYTTQNPVVQYHIAMHTTNVQTHLIL